ncbi:uncharacterized protein METZ01_LOCUS282053, partial [marine metagenome]
VLGSIGSGGMGTPIAELLNDEVQRMLASMNADLGLELPHLGISSGDRWADPLFGTRDTNPR